MSRPLLSYSFDYFHSCRRLKIASRGHDNILQMTPTAVIIIVNITTSRARVFSRSPLRAGFCSRNALFFRVFHTRPAANDVDGVSTWNLRLIPGRARRTFPSDIYQTLYACTRMFCSEYYFNNQLRAITNMRFEAASPAFYTPKGVWCLMFVSIIVYELQRDCIFMRGVRVCSRSSRTGFLIHGAVAVNVYAQ